jgi:hypothetical protein
MHNEQGPSDAGNIDGPLTSQSEGDASMADADYERFLDRKTQGGADHGFEPLWLPDFLFDFQRAMVQWSVRKGRAAIFADCGLGKTPMGLVWASNVARRACKPVLYLTPLAVTAQTVREAEKFGIEAIASREGASRGHIVITNYERLHYFEPVDFAGVVCDESSILKSYDGRRRSEITAFMRKMPYRLLQTATAAPNDYIELGTSSEALGYMGHMDMLNRFFKNDLNNSAQGRFAGEVIKWRLKGHAELPFWRWVCSWARARVSALLCLPGLYILQFPQLLQVFQSLQVEPIPSHLHISTLSHHSHHIKNIERIDRVVI